MLRLRNGETLVRLARFANVQTGVTLHEGRTLGGDVVTLPYLRVANVQPGWLDLSEIKTVTISKSMASRSTLRNGDVLMTEGETATNWVVERSGAERSRTAYTRTTYSPFGLTRSRWSLIISDT